MHFQNFIDGQWRGSKELRPNINPSDTNDVFGEYCAASVSEAEEAMAVARNALDTWRWTTPTQRADLLERVAVLLAERASDIARDIAREEGKTVAEALGETMVASRLFRYYAGEPLRHPGTALPSLRAGIDVTVTYEPVGVVANITPWNYPIAVPARKIAPALAYGNTVVLKPSEFTPAAARALTQALVDAGVPRGVFNMVMGDGKALGAALVGNCDAVSFTGSGPTGRRILELALPTMAKVQLELGGKNPLVIMADANIDQAIDIALRGTFTHAGQRCTSSSRILVEASIYDRVCEGMIRGLREFRIGHALDDTTEVGPVANEQQLMKALGFIDTTLKQGGELAVGGEVLSLRTPGYYISPALFVGTTNDMTVNREEVFGPVATLSKVEDLDEAISISNDSDFALSSGICTTSIAAAEKFRRRSKAGLVTVNSPTAGLDYHIPFGGRAPSGYGGREDGWGAAEFFTEMKSSYINHGVV